MDYSHAAYFQGAQPPYHPFIGIPPLTPSHSNSAPSEDFSTTSPPEVYTDFNGEQHYPNFDAYNGQFNGQQPFRAGPPTPPTQQPVAHGAHSTTNQVLANGTSHPGIKPPHPTDILPLTKPEDDNSKRAGSNSDDDDLTPAQSRRKAQNRAAQRAFRERKERHVKDLEAKLATLEQSQQLTASENEKLKRDIQKISTENEILRATSSMPGGGSPGTNGLGAPAVTGPQTYNPTDFYTDLLEPHANKSLSHRITKSENGERLFAAAATWDYIIGHDLFKKGLVDVADISNRLKNQARCDGQGPVFEESAILMAIEQSVGSGSDELI